MPAIHGCLVKRLPLSLALAFFVAGATTAAADESWVDRFDARSTQNGAWTDADTWHEGRVPQAGDRVFIAPRTRVVYEADSEAVIPSIHVAGTLSFARDRDTLLNVGVIKIQPAGDETAPSPDEAGVEDVDEHDHHQPADTREAALELGTPDAPIPAAHVARIRLHAIEGMDPENTPAIVCRPGGRMDFHGAPMDRTWVELGDDVKSGDTTVTLARGVDGWRVGDEIIVTASEHHYARGSFRDPDNRGTAERTITSIEGDAITVDRPFDYDHAGSGRDTSEVANLSRNVIVESADPEGVRGHTMYHRHSAGSISYARFAHLGKETTLGRYPIHFHMVRDTMRGSSVVGAAIVDSHNRWVTIHGTQYLVVRDCVGYQSVGHGYFLEDGTEVYNVLDRNLGVQAYLGDRMRGQPLPFDPNDGGAFWWANGRNTFIRNVAAENDRYGFRYDSQERSNFDSTLAVRTADGDEQPVDIRTIENWRFADNESHTEGLYSFAFAGTDGVGPPTTRPHHLANLSAWQTHYALRMQLPTMLIENARVEDAAYGIYRPWFDNHAYRDIHLKDVSAEPFNRGHDDRSEQHGKITVDGLTFEGDRYGRRMPLIQISDNNLSGSAESHFRNISAPDPQNESNPDNVKPLVNRGGGRVVPPETDAGVPIYLHDHLGEGQHVKVVSTEANDFNADRDYEQAYPLTGEEAAFTVVDDVDWPELLTPRDEHPPATVVTWPREGDVVHAEDDRLTIHGVTTDNHETHRVTVNGQQAADVDYNFHRWRVTLEDVEPGELKITASAEDVAGNTERTPHTFSITVAP